jgi:hypothetical protein
LPDALLGLLEAPGGFMIGIHYELPNSDSDEGQNKQSIANYIKELHITHPMSPGIYNKISISIYTT